MRGVATALVHALKYGGWPDLAEEMGARMAAVCLGRDVEEAISVVVAVPLSATRLRERGYNQAELLAREVAQLRGWPLLTGLLTRSRHTRRQARLAPRARLANVSGAFEVDRERRTELADAHLLLVDDVVTTGATVQDCVRALCRAGARSVSVLSFARARRELPVAGR